MAKITRKTAKIFGSTAGASQIAKYGSLAAGSPVLYSGASADPANIQALGNWLSGWFSGVEAGNSPAIEDMNAYCYVMAYQIAYSLEMGIAEWDSDTTYYIGSVVKDASSANYYISKTDNNLNNAVSDTANWIVMIDQIASQVTSVGANLICNARTRSVSDYATLGNIFQSPVSGNITSDNGAGEVTVVSSAKTFTSGNVNTGTDTITVTSHGMVTGQLIQFTSTVSLPSPLVAGTDYFAIVLTSSTFQVASSLANALVPTPIDITTTGSGTHSLFQLVGGSLVTHGNQVRIEMISDPASFQGSFYLTNDSNNATITGTIFLKRDGSNIAALPLTYAAGSGYASTIVYPPSIISFTDKPSSGTHTYKMTVAGGTGTTLGASTVVMTGYEL